MGPSIQSDDAFRSFGIGSFSLMRNKCPSRFDPLYISILLTRAIILIYSEIKGIGFNFRWLVNSTLVRHDKESPTPLDSILIGGRAGMKLFGKRIKKASLYGC